MNTNYCQVVEMTNEEKTIMYSKMTKKQLVAIIVEKEKHEPLFLGRTQDYIPNYFITTST